jgi:hypothetical protein
MGYMSGYLGWGFYWFISLAVAVGAVLVVVKIFSIDASLKRILSILERRAEDKKSQ